MTGAPAAEGRLRRGLAVALVACTVVMFAAAIVAVPVSGANAPDALRVPYPYLDTADRYPCDFVWQYFGLAYSLLLVGLVSADVRASEGASLRGIAGRFAAAGAVVLLADYYLQLNVVPVSLLRGETEGLPLLIQYNPRGVFIALEELGYLLVNLGFLGLVLCREPRLRAASVAVAVLSAVNAAYLVYASLRYGLDRQDRFEVVLVTTVWTMGVFYAAGIAREGRDKGSIQS